MKKSFLLAGVVAVAGALSSCKQKDNVDIVHYSEEDYATISQYLDLPQLPPSYKAALPNHLTRQGLSAVDVDRDEATLGRVLFYDKNLSSDKTISCASCHRQEIGFSDDRAVSLGVESRVGERNSIALSSVANFSAYYGTDLNGGAAIPFFWDNRAETASAQNIASMINPLEMNMTEHQIVEAVKAQPYYKPLFKMAYGSEEISTVKVSKAIAAFVNSMGSYQSRFDAGANSVLNGAYDFSSPYERDFASFSAQENRGKQLYMDNCASCHSNSFGRPVKLYANNGIDEVTTDPGVGGVSGAASQKGTFKVPTLRNIALTAPYMHDGRFATLEQVIDHYSTGIKSHPNLSAELRYLNNEPRKFNFSGTDKADLVAFLNTLTDDVFRADSRYANPFK